MATCLVTGGAGFIGSHLSEGLASAGWRVRVLDDLSTGVAANLAGLSEVELIQGDVSDPDAVARATGANRTIAIHSAGSRGWRLIDEPVA